VGQKAVIVINAQSVIQIVNAAALELLGYSKGDIKGKNLRMIMPPSAAGMVTPKNHRSFSLPNRQCVLDTQLQSSSVQRLCSSSISSTKVSGLPPTAGLTPTL
jgi:PAS domain-containing protein